MGLSPTDIQSMGGQGFFGFFLKSKNCTLELYVDFEIRTRHPNEDVK